MANDLGNHSIISILSKNTTTSTDIGEKTLSTARILFESRPDKDPDCLFPKVLNLDLRNLRKISNKELINPTTVEYIESLNIWWRDVKTWYMSADRILTEDQFKSVPKVKAIGWSLVTLIAEHRCQQQAQKVVGAAPRYKFFYKRYPPEKVLGWKLKRAYDPKNRRDRAKYNVALVDCMIRSGYLTGNLKVYKTAEKKDDLAVAILQAIYDKFTSLKNQ